MLLFIGFLFPLSQISVTLFSGVCRCYTNTPKEHLLEELLAAGNRLQCTQQCYQCCRFNCFMLSESNIQTTCQDKLCITH